MRFGFVLLAALVTLSIAERGAACQFDTDCEPGSQCLKRGGQIYGVCVGGLQPGNEHDRQPAQDPQDPNRTSGNMCQVDSDCGPGSKCSRPGGGIYGTCIR